jgi:serine protease Do
MRIAAAIAAVAVAGLVCAPAAAQPDALAEFEAAQEALFDRISPSVVFIASNGGFGSGFFVADDGLVLTSAHVVTGQKSVQVALGDGRTVKGEVVERAGDNVDLALVQVPIRGKALPLADDNALRVGAWVATVGHGAGGIWSFNSGLVSNIYAEGSERPVFQTQIPVNPGSSGGPIFDRRGRVVGIVTAGLKDAQGINFAIRSGVALRTLGRLAGGCACLVVNLPPKLPLFVDGKMAGLGPRVVIAAEPRTYELFVVVNGVMKKKRVRFPDERAATLE